VLDEGLSRYPESWLLHDRLRSQILGEKRVAELEATYERMLARPNAAPNLEWFAGYSSIVAAEYHRRAGQREQAVAAYRRAIAHYRKLVEKSPEAAPSADHYVAVALAGQARIAYESGDDEQALAQVIQSFERKPSAAASLDGLNFSAVDTAKMLRARCVEKKQDVMVAQIDAALSALPPAMLELPEFERDSGRPGGGGNRPRRR
jgi:tetratricopeptide (TPR) repeat protein